MEHADLALLHVPGMDLAIDAGLAHAPRDQLGVLGTEIQDQDAVGMYVAVCVHVVGAIQLRELSSSDTGNQTQREHIGAISRQQLM